MNLVQVEEPNGEIVGHCISTQFVSQGCNLYKHTGDIIVLSL